VAACLVGQLIDRLVGWVGWVGGWLLACLVFLPLLSLPLKPCLL